MSHAAVEYAERTEEGGWRISGSRVSLDSIVRAYWEGLSPEAIQEEFSSLSSEQVYGAIAFYLRRREEIDDFLFKQDANWRKLQEESEAAHGPLLDRIRATRRSDERRG